MKPDGIKFFLVCLFVSSLWTKPIAVKGQIGPNAYTRYCAENNAIMGRDLSLYNNRPLYCNNTNAFILTGDKPLMRFVQSPFIYGSFMMALSHRAGLKWLTDCSSIKMEYSGNRTTWTITDSSCGFPVVRLSVIPMADKVGLVIHARIENPRKDDKLIWRYGGVEYDDKESLSWKLDINGHPAVGQWDFAPGSCKNNRIKIQGDTFFVRLIPDSLNKTISGMAVQGICSAEGKIEIRAADKAADRHKENSESGSTLPIVSGTIALDKRSHDLYWSMRPVDAKHPALRQLSPETEWQNGLRRIEELANRIVVKTPDARLNALASVSAAAIDAVWYDPVFVHGAMLWNVPFPGWRTLYGGIMYGWHERVKKQARYYIASQITHSTKLQAKADSSLLMTLQDRDSRFYGSGRIDKDQMFYNFQSQFFDQLVTAWRSSGDSELENLLQPALELHLKWQEECFDPDGDGIFESYINGWPTDSQWYHGGGTAEETSYAYRGHQAAHEMAQRKGDPALAAYHGKKLAQIKRGFFEKLWVANKGFSGAYREQGGYQRLHEDPWLYSIFLPIDAKLVSRDQAVGSLYYTQSILQNDRMPAGGRRVWTSNWVPGIFSVRELYPGDNYHLALAYFLSGMGDEGWDIMRGTFYEGAFNGKVPGDLGTQNGGTDFNDCSSMFSRVLLEGLFGYRPDYPNGTVTLAPHFPKEWESASIRTPDFGFQYQSAQDRITAAVQLKKSAAIDFYLPIRVTGVKTVLVDGRPHPWELLPGYGQSLLHLTLAAGARADIDVYPTGMVTQYDPIFVEKNIGDAFQLKFAEATITGIVDLQKALKQMEVKDGMLSATVSNNSGHHTLLAEVLVQKARQKRIVYLNINDKQMAAEQACTTWPAIPADAQWDCVNMSHLFNADVRTIFQQKYLSPRPNTVSVRIGTDGYSPWTFLFWKQSPPEIKLDSVQYLLQGAHQLMTKQQVPFHWNDFSRNIAFTSLWDNWPRAVTVPVHRKGEGVWLLVCGSTNPMQCHIANANLILTYADRSMDTLALVPPLNYWNLTPVQIQAGAAGQLSRADYTHDTDRFCVPRPWPQTVPLGENCRAMLLHRRLKSGIELQSVTLQTLSEEVVIGLMGLCIMKSNKR